MSGRRDSSRGDMGESIRQALGKHVKILHKVPMKLEKGGGDRTDNRVLVFTPHRLFVMTAKVGFHASWKEEVTHLPHFSNPFIVGPTQEMQLGESRVARKKSQRKQILTKQTIDGTQNCHCFVYTITSWIAMTASSTLSLKDRIPFLG